MTAWYVYDDLTFDGDDDLQWGGEGNPVRIITEQAADPGVYSAVHFVYDLGQRVWLMYGESWEADGADEGDCPDNYEIVWAREFRYDGGRARYLNRELDPAELQDNGVLAALEDGEETWTVYDGDEPYADYTVEEHTPHSTVTDLRSYEPGVALKDPIDESSGISYYHTDHLGTTRAMTDSGGAAFQAAVYTAFGERIDAGGHHRYGYVGAYGYQAHDFPEGSPIQFLHVGARYYDPTTGRFLQRDPMGIEGGSNVYAYVVNTPSTVTDPDGMIGMHDPLSPAGLNPPAVAPREGMSFDDFALYLERNRWNWGWCTSWIRWGSFGNVGISTLFGRVRAGVGTPPHWTSWQHKVANAIGGNGSAVDAAGRGIGRISLAPLIWEGFWDLGVLIRYPFDNWDYR